MAAEWALFEPVIHEAEMGEPGAPTLPEVMILLRMAFYSGAFASKRVIDANGREAWLKELADFKANVDRNGVPV